MVKTYNVLPAVIIIILLYVAGSQWLSAREERANAKYYAEQYALKDSVLQVTETAKAELALATHNKDNLIVAMGRDLADAHERLDLKPRSVVTTQIQIRTDTVTVTLQDTITIRDGLEIVSWPFRVRKGRYLVSGSVYPEDRTLDMAISQDAIRLAVIMSQTKQGNFLTTVDTGDTSLVIGDINATVLVRKPGWFERNRFRLGFLSGAGVVAGLITIAR